MGDCNCGTCRAQAITRIARALRDEPQRRKTLFFIGERIQLAPVPGACNAYLEPATKEMVNATQLANVTVHAVDPNALETTNVHAGDDFMPEGASAAAAAQERANRDFLIERHQSLQTVADWTGGRAILNTNVPEESVRPILDESSAYYLLAFEAVGREARRALPSHHREGQSARRAGAHAKRLLRRVSDSGEHRADYRRLSGGRLARTPAGTRPAHERDGRAVPRSEWLRDRPRHHRRQSEPASSSRWETSSGRGEIAARADRDPDERIHRRRQGRRVAAPAGVGGAAVRARRGSCATNPSRP